MLRKCHEARADATNAEAGEADGLDDGRAGWRRTWLIWDGTWNDGVSRGG